MKTKVTGIPQQGCEKGTNVSTRSKPGHKGQEGPMGGAGGPKFDGGVVKATRGGKKSGR